MSAIEGKHKFCEDKDMEQIRIVAIPTKVAESVRGTGRAPVMDARLTARWAPTLRLADIAYA
jgi:hypothetical protein